MRRALDAGTRRITDVTPFKDAVIQYSKLNLILFPLGGEEGKAPLVRWSNFSKGQAQATREKLAKNHGAANVGLTTGRLNGVSVLDVDCEDWQKYIELAGDTPLKARTPCGGLHLFYSHCGERNKNLRAQGYEADVKGAGGFVCIAPSYNRQSGIVYEWLSDPGL